MDYVVFLRGIKRRRDLQHDLNGMSVRALETFIPWALENGYTFLPLDMTSPVIHMRVNN